ncbi:ABC transporter substrate-binding protein [Neobacillus notoginsengisoli]|uniref:ABC transporter substrate-binding protein n=1 Tax=Neobacillus notoginsengisoli TaxID=1578198 RepID=UPI001314EE14|nr:ABC transporter substrate-binding protein [Neobacillus notoginsengisoli]
MKLNKELLGESPIRTVHITISGLANILECSERNVKYIIKEMDAQGWVEWKPKAGRGHASSLSFIRKAEEVFFKIARQKLDAGDFAWSFSQLKYLDMDAREQYFQLLPGYFGFHEIEKNNRSLDVARVLYPSPGITLSPRGPLYIEQTQIVKQIFDTLVRFNEETGKIEPHIAHHYEIEPSGQALHFYIRKGVFFHNGMELTGSDIKYSFEEMISQGGRGILPRMFKNIKRIDVQQPYHVSIYLKEPNFLFIHLLGYPEASIVPEKIHQALGDDFNRHPIGSGPFKVAEHTKKRLVLDAHAIYFKERPLLDQLQFYFVPEIIHFNAQLPAHLSTINRIESHDFERGATFLTFNQNKSGICQNNDFRKALYYGLDKQGLTSKLQSSARPADSFLSEREHTPKYNPELASIYLQNSGYSRETIHLFTKQGNTHVKSAEILKEQWSKLGVDVAIHSVSLEEIGTGDFYNVCDIFLSKELISGSDADLELIELQSRFKWFLNDDLITGLKKVQKQIFRESSPQKRYRHYLRIEKSLKRDFLVIFLFRNKQMLQTSLNSLEISLYGYGTPFDKLWNKPASVSKI